MLINFIKCRLLGLQCALVIKVLQWETRAVAFDVQRPVGSLWANRHLSLSLFLYAPLLTHLLRSRVSSLRHFPLYFWRHIYSGMYSNLELRGNTKNSDTYFTGGDSNSVKCVKYRQRLSILMCKCIHNIWGLLLMILEKCMLQYSIYKIGC